LDHKAQSGRLLGWDGGSGRWEGCNRLRKKTGSGPFFPSKDQRNHDCAGRQGRLDLPQLQGRLRSAVFLQASPLL